MLSIEYREAIVELLEILENSDEDIVKKIPKDLMEFWEKNKSKTYKPNLDHSKPLTEMELKPKTRALIGMIYLNYLCNDEEMVKTKRILISNEEKYQEKLREKYNPDDIFKMKKQYTSSEKNVETTADKSMINYKSSFFNKIICAIKNFFKKR